VSIASVNGAELWYELRGEGARLVLLHGGGTDARMWDEHVAALAERFRVLRFDARGCGRSSLSGGPSSSVEDLVGLLDEVAFERGALVGLSRGARVAIETALLYPARVSALVLAAPTLRGRQRPADVRRFAAQEDELVERGEVDAAIEAGHRLWLAGPHRRLEDIDPVLRRRLADMERDAYATYLAADPKPGPDAPPPDYELGRIAIPTLVVVGELDVDEVLENAERLEAEIPGACKVVMPAVGHMVSLECPHDFTRLIVDFLTA
jgi:3-oxoadipate enol-lactonase